MLNCEDRHNYETYKYTCPTRTNSVTTECQQVTNVQDTISVCLPEGGENWDDVSVLHIVSDDNNQIFMFIGMRGVLRSTKIL